MMVRLKMEKKYFYKVLDHELLYEGLRSVGGVQTDFITKILAAPASLLRDTVTRDPGFVVVNVLRDTLSSAVTSGAPITGADGFTPVIDSFKNLFADMEDLEKFGVLGGYDFQNDEGSVKQFIDRTMRQQKVYSLITLPMLKICSLNFGMVWVH